MSDELHHWEECVGLEACAELETAYHVTIFDSQWGRNDYLWELVKRELIDGGPPNISPDPDPHLGLNEDFVWRPINS